MNDHATDTDNDLPPFKPTGAIVLWLVLLVLLGITWASAYVDLGIWNPVVNIGVAVLKAVLIMWFFMHLNESGSNTRIMAIGAFFWLAILITITLTDYQTRPDHSAYTEASAADDAAGRRATDADREAVDGAGEEPSGMGVPLLRGQ